MGTVIAALKWLARFLDSRFPPKVDPRTLSTKEEVKLLLDIVDSRFAGCAKEVDELKKQIQTLNLRVGLSRSIQTTFKEKF